MNRGKRLPDGTVPKLEDVRESCGGWAGEIAAKCRAYGMPVGVVVIVMPLQDPQPQFATANLTAEGVQRVLRSVSDSVAAKGGGIAIAGPDVLKNMS